MQVYKKLRIWQKAHALSLKAHRLVRGFPRRYASLAGQIRRSAESVPANIVEGRYRRTDADFARFLYQALSSLMELDYHLVFAHDEGIIDQRTLESLQPDIEELRRMILAFIKKLNGSA